MRLRRGETLAKVEEWRRAASDGDVEAMLILAAITGRSPETATESERWWQTALDAGSLIACRHFGVLAARGGDLAEAERMFRRGAEGGELDCMCGLAYVYELRGDHEAAGAAMDMILRHEEQARAGRPDHVEP